MLKIGCCGFAVSYKRYMKEFSVVEVQQSFYRRLGERQVKNWKSAAPENFEFVLKAPQCVTHPPNSPTYRRSDLPKDERRQCGFFKLTTVVKREMDIFLERAKVLEAKLFLFQTPASFKPTDENIENMIKFFNYYRGVGIFAWEPRGREWTEDIVRDICKKLNLIHATDPFLELPQLWGDFTYFRMHGDLRTYNYDYSEEEIKRILSLAKRDGYIFFNNSAMYKNAKKALELLSNV